jgi:hypothetical protein
MRRIRLVITFYRSFVVTSSLVSLLCFSALLLYGLKTFSAIFIFKLITLGVIVLYINLYKKREFYYYQNLGLPKIKLWTYALGLDFLLFISSIIMLLSIL